MYNENPSNPTPSNVTEPARSAQPIPNQQNFLAEPTLNQQNTPTIEDVEAKPEAFWQNIEGKWPLLKKSLRSNCPLEADILHLKQEQGGLYLRRKSKCPADATSKQQPK